VWQKNLSDATAVVEALKSRRFQVHALLDHYLKNPTAA
jgi:hypothetical protein